MTVDGLFQHGPTATFTINRHLGCLWSKIGTFQLGIELCKRATMPILNWMFKNTIESFQMRYCMQFFLQRHQNCKNLKCFRIYLIKADFFGSFNFDFWQFCCPLRKNCVQYLIWKLSLVFLNIILKMGMAAHLHSSIPTWKVLILLHKQAKWWFIVKVAVYLVTNIWNQMSWNQRFWNQMKPTPKVLMYNKLSHFNPPK